MSSTFNIEVSESNGYIFNDANTNDSVLYQVTPNTNIRLGTSGNVSSAVIGLSNISLKVAGTDPSNSFIRFATGTSNVKLAVTESNVMVYNTLVANSNMGIGKSNPAYPLDVNGIVNSTGLYVNGAPYIGSQWTTSGSNLFITGSNVGIGTSSPQYPLHVQGAIYSSADVYTFSDARFKSNLEIISNAVDKVKALTGYTFDLEGSDVRHTGLIAQDVRGVLGEATTVDSDGRLGVSYGNLAGLFIEAIKDIERRLSDLEAYVGKE